MSADPRRCDGCTVQFTPRRPEQRFHDLDCARRHAASSQRRYTCAKCGDQRIRKPGKRRPNALVCMTCERARDRARRARRRATSRGGHPNT